MSIGPTASQEHPFQPTQPAIPPPVPPRRRSPLRWVGIGCGTLAALTVCATILGAVASRGSSSPTATAAIAASTPAGTIAVAANQPAPTTAPTSAPAAQPTATPRPAAPTATPRPEPTPRPQPTATAAPAAPAKVGDTATTRNYTMTLHALQNPATATGPLPPPEGKKRVALDVTITNTSGQEVAYNPFYAKLRLADNTEANVTFGGVEPALQSGKLGTGEAARGWLTFDIPTDAQPATFVYEIITFGSGGRITFNLR